MALEEKGLKKNMEKSLEPWVAQWHVLGPFPSLFTRTHEEGSQLPSPFSPPEISLRFLWSLMASASCIHWGLAPSAGTFLVLLTKGDLDQGTIHGSREPD